MQLSYRGISYNNEPCTAETIPSDVTAQFLGQKYQVRRLVNPSVVTSRQALKYRGIIH
ncbi:MAG: DUF4278 domain-containing protein [Desertifilum sp.]|nr:DUF4278 domain-containing protein [Desertifilum sp.]MDI9638666.1 DUF4278 domain-containing protein [Geitlerinema splendidum]NES94195.1 DUF4278 domain-containing protein [Desertifilum sp. SIO1I2]